jgi:transcriptional regulator with XRE-family HTH domain
MNSRIKMIRTKNDMTQDEFGKRIGSARNTIANYENGNRVPSNAVITSICREFNVNETWLRTGEGEMFLPIERETDIARLTMQLLTEESDSFKNRLISALSRLSEEEWEVIEKTFDSVVNAKKE